MSCFTGWPVWDAGSYDITISSETPGSQKEAEAGRKNAYAAVLLSEVWYDLYVSSEG
jgi:hypothetical protein